MENVSIILADSEYLVRLGLKSIIKEQPSCKIVSEVTNEQQLFLELEKKVPDMVVLDYKQPGHFTSETVVKIKKKYNQVRILVISADEDKKTIFQVLENGVDSYLSKQCGKKEIVNAVLATAKNEKFFCTNVVNYLLEKSFSKGNEAATAPALTAREKEVVGLVASGLIAKEIASKLNLSTHTIYTHRKNIMKKLDIGTTSELVLYAVKEGLI
ncbi:MAG TPA: response regulator transcription factor [Bacteroidetes bacterium]|nr:response regulator transcription factor [Bacteroidota bacterium]